MYIINESKEKDMFIEFIKHMINVDLSDRIEDTKLRGVIKFYYKGTDVNVLRDISRFSRQYEKYKITDGGASQINIIFQNSKFWKTTTFNWTPGF